MDSKELQVDTYKIVLVGDASVGKTHLLKKYSKNETPKIPTPTIGVEFGTKIVELRDNVSVKAQIWDTAGQERYRGILSLHFRRAVGALLVYDVTKEKTFQSIQKWMEDLKYLSDPDIVIMLVGNKVDVVQQNPESRKVSTLDGQQFAAKNKLLFLETSATEGINVKSVFEDLLQEIYNLKQKQPMQPIDSNGAHKLKVPDQQQTDADSKCSC